MDWVLVDWIFSLGKGIIFPNPRDGWYAATVGPRIDRKTGDMQGQHTKPPRGGRVGKRNLRQMSLFVFIAAPHPRHRIFPSGSPNLPSRADVNRTSALATWKSSDLLYLRHGKQGTFVLIYLSTPPLALVDPGGRRGWHRLGHGESTRIDRL